ncbi:MAG: Fis family transcriptional regulator [Deltaproteobacteria bacterium HGW-Deltaproteobacteria-6]|jgi:two-component system NtrC family response regulator|nr:MAG: Fis family transcriptional regulator [Deltaproteobacteria bacterium HGW-Deltaproteobacteria-6]
MARVLIIDDDQGMCKMLSRKIKSMDHEVDYAYTIEEGVTMMKATPYDVAFLDVHLPDGNGIEALPLIRKISPASEVIIMTGLGDHQGAESAIKNGAWDYIEKPSTVNLMVLPLVRVLQYKEASTAPKTRLTVKRDGIIGQSQGTRNSLDQIGQVAASNTNVLITGETGTGKELFAWAIHQNSPRASKNFVIVDCTILTETLVEGMLFGHEKGAFTSADRMREGLIEQADGGTLFLDEVGELPFSVQKSFLRVLQEHRFRPLGSKHELSSDFRLVAATNRDLDKMVAHGEFREDLLFRIRSFVIGLQPLRERLDDIEELVTYKIGINFERHGTKMMSPSPDFLQALTAYDWPGNVRELFSTVEQAIIMAGNRSVLFPNDLPSHIRIKLSQSQLSRKDVPIPREGNISGPGYGRARLQDVRDAAVESAEKEYLNELKVISGNNIDKACAISGLSQSRLYSLLKKYGIKFS